MSAGLSDFTRDRPEQGSPLENSCTSHTHTHTPCTSAVCFGVLHCLTFWQTQRDWHLCVPNQSDSAKKYILTQMDRAIRRQGVCIGKGMSYSLYSLYFGNMTLWYVSCVLLHEKWCLTAWGALPFFFFFFFKTIVLHFKLLKAKTCHCSYRHLLFIYSYCIVLRIYCY